MKSYAQDQEDIILKLMLHNVKRGFYVDIGANDPEYLSVTKMFYDEGWNGVNVDPLPEIYSKLMEVRKKDINICAGIGNCNMQHVPLYVKGMLSSFKKIKDAERVEDVEVITLSRLAKLLTLHSKDVHFCKIDVEGFERQVLEGNDWNYFRPWVFCIESTVPETNIPCWQDWEIILEKHNYGFVYEHGINRYYYDKNRTKWGY